MTNENKDMMSKEINNIQEVITNMKVVGDPLYFEDGVIIPVNKVTYGYGMASKDKTENNTFLGGAVGGLTMIPEAILYIVGHDCSIIWIKKEPNAYQKALDLVLSILKKK